MRQMPADSAEMLLAMERNFPNFDWNCHYRLVDHMMICKPKEVTIPPPPMWSPTPSIWISQISETAPIFKYIPIQLAMPGHLAAVSLKKIS